ncbi:MAG: hypothetical protein ACP5IE_09920 [Infirmifilum sp.]
MLLCYGYGYLFATSGKIVITDLLYGTLLGLGHMFLDIFTERESTLKMGTGGGGPRWST